jgi:hypothetical protein
MPCWRIARGRAWGHVETEARGSRRPLGSRTSPHRRGRTGWPIRVPHRRPAGHVPLASSAVVPAQAPALPRGLGLLEHLRQLRPALAFDARASVRARLARGSRHMQGRIQPQRCHQADAPAATGTSPFVDTVGLGADDRQLHPGPPAAPPQDHLARAVRHGRRPQPPTSTHLGGRGGHTQHGQGPRPPGPGWSNAPRQHGPAHPAGGPRAWLARGQRIAVMPPLGDATAPAPLQRLVDDKDAVTARSNKGPHSPPQQASTQPQCGPARAVEHVMLEAEVGCLVHAHVAAGGRHGPPTAGQAGPEAQHWHFPPGGLRKG